MSEQSRTSWKPDGPGPYIGIITNHQLYSFMGSVEVSIIKGSVDDAYSVLAEHITVRYLSPFYGATNLAFQTGTSGLDDYNDTQKSYGMWMVPPDLGVRVMCIFVDGDTSQGYWMGCVMDRNMNHMLPGIAAGLPDSPTPNLPVAEYNKKAYGTTGDTFSGPNSSSIVRPIHPFAYVLQNQGLLGDPLRGITSSGARREAPSMVFGISTPGPVDTSPNAPKASVTTDAGPSTVYPSRLGGTTFVMDDGDMDDTGNITNELVRIRTRTGHQILMHNTKDFIYINNSQGTAWIELTSNGKIDIYAAEAVSIHTKDSFNFRADNDINFDAGGNINFHAFNSVNINSGEDLSLIAGTTGLISSSGELAVTSNTALKLAGPTLDVSAGKIRVAGTFDVKGKSTFSGPTELHGSPEAAQPTTLKAVPLTVNSVGGTNSTLLRIPDHEPWLQHEDTDPDAFNVVNLSASRSSSNFKTIPGGKPPLNVPAPAAVDATGAILFNEGEAGKVSYTKTTEDFRLRFDAMAVNYKQLTGNPLSVNSTFRTKEYQQALYDAWAGAKGGDTRVTSLGKITTPVNPRTGQTSPHMQGRAADLNENLATILATKKWDQLGGKTLLEKYGFTWGGNFAKPDRVHIQVELGAQPVTPGPNVLVVIFRGTPPTVASADIDKLVAEINKMPNHSASAYNWEAASKTGIDQGLISKISKNNGPVVLIGYSKGAESIKYIADALPKIQFTLALYLDPWPSVIFAYMTDSTMSNNIQKGVVWYSKASAWPPEYKNRTPSGGGRVTVNEIGGNTNVHAQIPATLTPEILTFVREIKVDKTNTTE